MFTIHAVLSQEISFLNKRIWFLNYPQSIFTWFLAQVKSSRAYVDPRRPIWMTLWGSRHPSSTARRKGVPWAIFSPSWVSRVSEWASIWTIPTGPYRSWNYKTTIVKLTQSQNIICTKPKTLSIEKAKNLKVCLKLSSHYFISMKFQLSIYDK